MYIEVDTDEQYCVIILEDGESLDKARENAFRILDLFGLRVTAKLTILGWGTNPADGLEEKFHISHGS